MQPLGAMAVLHLAWSLSRCSALSTSQPSALSHRLKQASSSTSPPCIRSLSTSPSSSRLRSVLSVACCSAGDIAAGSGVPKLISL